MGSLHTLVHVMGSLHALVSVMSPYSEFVCFHIKLIQTNYTTIRGLPHTNGRPMAMIRPPLSKQRTGASQQKAVYDHGHHPFPSPKEEMRF